MHVVPTMRGVVRALGLVAILFSSVCAAEAAPVYDGSAPMQCAIKSVMVCDDPSICVRGTAQTVDDGSYCSASGEIRPWITKNCPRFLATFLARRLPSELTVSQLASAAAEVMPLTTADVKRFPANPPAPIINAMPGL